MLLLTTVTFLVTYPIDEICSSAFLATLSVKLPFMSVTVPLPLPTILMVAPITGSPLVSVTVPVMWSAF